MKVKGIQIIVGVFGIIINGLKKKLGELDIRGKIKTTTVLRSARILQRLLETRRDLLLFKLQLKLL